MKKCVSMILAAVLLLTCICIGTPEAYAAKPDTTRAIAIVFDNSGSMYTRNNPAWCRATYATEAFAAMLNQGDVLQIYPMNPIKIGGKEYTMNSPFQITDASQASMIRDMMTEDAGDTHIESIDCAKDGLKKLKADEKYLIVLTDGGTFTKNGNQLSKDRTKKELDTRVTEYAGEDLTFMYLGIDPDACIPGTPESEYFFKEHAKDSKDVLSALTEMCNQIFGRDILPESRHTETSMEFDVSMKKLIIFVQGTDIADLKITGDGVGTVASSQQIKYSEKGTTDKQYEKNQTQDTSLQGMMVTYTDCAAGTYSIDYSGSATSVEVYYEPDVDLDFVFTNVDGSEVNPDALYEGEYKVSFGMKDAKTGKLTNSDLLGKPEYKGSYFINGEEHAIECNDASGEVEVKLNMDDTFDANLTVTYLSGYTISKNSTDFGWPEGGIKVAPRPVGEMKLEITGGDELYSLQELEKGSPFIAKVYLAGQQLTGKELEKVDLKWDPDTSNAEIKQTFAEDHYVLTMHYKDPEAPQNTVCGECTVDIHAFYTPKGSNEVQAQSPLTYNIEDDYSPLQIELFVPQSYIVIKELDASQAMVVDLTLNGAPLTAEEFALVQGLQVETSGIEYTLTPNEQKSSYQIKLVATEGIAEGDYPVSVKALYVDQIGREYESMEQTALITLDSMPLWMKWLIRIGLLLLLLIIIWIITHIKVMPKKVLTPNRVGTLKIGATDVDNGVTYPTKRSGSTLSVLCKKGAGTPFGIKMTVAPGSDSYLYKSSKKRSMEVQPTKVVLQNGGGATVTEANINGVRYKMDPVTHKFGPVQQNTKPFVLKNNANVKWSGTILDNGKQKSFSVTTKLDFKDKK